jgi:uncharacterized membrane protein YgdD (TMEM256/DUF423 family)
MNIVDRILIVVGALAGLAGVALSAAGAHITGAAGLTAAASLLLAHAPVLILAGLIASLNAAHRILARLAGLAFILGLSLFCGDAAMRAFMGSRLFSNAAPAGGIILMCGWALLALAGLMRRRRR